MSKRNEQHNVKIVGHIDIFLHDSADSFNVVTLLTRRQTSHRLDTSHSTDIGCGLPY